MTDQPTPARRGPIDYAREHAAAREAGAAADDALLEIPRDGARALHAALGRLLAEPEPASAERELEQLRDQLGDAWQKFADVCGQRDRLRHRMNALADRWDLEGPPPGNRPLTELRAEISIEPLPDCPDPIECGHEAALGQAEATIARVRAECDRIEVAVRANPTAPDFDGAYLAAIGHIRRALDPQEER